jgi:hypothetical protein
MASPFGLFQILTGSIPDIGDTLVVPAVETYSDGTVVNWDQPPTTNGEEPDKPAPVVKRPAPLGKATGSRRPRPRPLVAPTARRRHPAPARTTRHGGWPVRAC